MSSKQKASHYLF